MKYVITNGASYVCYTGNKISATNFFKDALQFASEEVALDVMKRIPAKYRQWKIMQANEQEIKALAKKNAQKAQPKNSQATQTNTSKRIPIDPMIRKYIYKQADGKCALCGKPVKYDDFTVDHIVPLSMGGENDIDNFQCTCKACNQFKSNILPEDFIQRVSDIYKHNADKHCKHGIKKFLLKGILSLVE